MRARHDVATWGFKREMEIVSLSVGSGGWGKRQAAITLRLSSSVMVFLTRADIWDGGVFGDW